MARSWNSILPIFWINWLAYASFIRLSLSEGLWPFNNYLVPHEGRIVDDAAVPGANARR